MGSNFYLGLQMHWKCLNGLCLKGFNLKELFSHEIKQSISARDWQSNFKDVGFEDRQN